MEGATGAWACVTSRRVWALVQEPCLPPPCRSDASIPPSGSGSLVSVSGLTLAWWVVLHPLASHRPLTNSPPHIGSRSQEYPRGEGTPYPLWGDIADRSSQPKMVRGVAEPTSYFHSLWKEGSRKAHR